jgi:hypothetical protein
VLEVARCRRSRYYGLYDNVYGDNSMYCLSVLCALFRRFTDVSLTLQHSDMRTHSPSLAVPFEKHYHKKKGGSVKNGICGREVPR